MTDQSDCNAFTCACGAQLGDLYTMADGTQLLQVGSVLIKEGHSMFCIHCGRSIHWSVSDKRTEKRIKHELRARINAE
jgi:hypothetical protein